MRKAFCLLGGKVCPVSSLISLRNVEESLRHVDATFFLGKVGFLATGGKFIPPLPLPHPHLLGHADPRGLGQRQGGEEPWKEGKNVSFRICPVARLSESRSEQVIPLRLFRRVSWGLPAAFRVKSQLPGRQSLAFRLPVWAHPPVTLPFLGSFLGSAYSSPSKSCSSGDCVVLTAELTVAGLSPALPVCQTASFLCTSSSLHSTL